jgi:Undecaprenyl-phosphate glucose phosphotransferase
MNVTDTILHDASRTTLWTDKARLDHFILPTLLRTLDLLTIALVGAATILTTEIATAEDLLRHAMGVGLVGAIFLARANAVRLYDIGAIMRPVSRLDDILIALTLASGATALIVLGLGVEESYDPWSSLLFAATSFVAVAMLRLGAFKVLDRLSNRGIIGRNIVVLGAGRQAQRFLRRFHEARPYFTTLRGVYHAGREAAAEGLGDRGTVFGGLEDLLRHAREGRIDDVVIAMPWTADRQVIDTVERLKELPLHVYLSTDLVGYELAFNPALGHADALPLFEVAQRPISGWSAALKTIEDYTLAGAALLLISPLMALIALTIKIDSPGPVFFMQERLGFNNKPFAIYKFRSMYHRDIPETMVRQAQKGDPRVTRVGRFIRATSLDELPQLLNVLNGTMSLVGPRPHALSHNEEYGRKIRGYFARHRVKPGITGWAQINGLRGETEALELMEARVRHDIYYADNWSLFLDIRILVMTVLVVLFQRTAY